MGRIPTRSGGTLDTWTILERIPSQGDQGRGPREQGLGQASKTQDTRARDKGTGLRQGTEGLGSGQGIRPRRQGPGSWMKGPGP